MTLVTVKRIFDILQKFLLSITLINFLDFYEDHEKSCENESDKSAQLEGKEEFKSEFVNETKKFIFEHRRNRASSV